MQILAYITDDKHRVISGAPLTLYMPDNEEREEYLQIFSEMTDADIMQMKNGDHIVLKN